MNHTLLIQYLQIIFAIYVFIMLFMKQPIKTTSDSFVVCLTLLLLSFIIVPPMRLKMFTALNIRKMENN